MTDVRGPAPPVAGANAIAARETLARSAVGTFRKLEAERAGNRVGFGEPQRQAPPNAIRLTRLLADKLSGRFVIAEILLAQRLGEDEAVVKWYRRNPSGYPWLESANPKYPRISAHGAQVMGKVIALLRSYP